MASKLSGKEFEEIRDTFYKMDSDKNGLVTRSELRNFFCAKRSDEEVDYIMRLMDHDSDDSIDFPECLKIVAVLDYKKTPHEYHFRQMFKALDKDNDGVISAAEVKSLWRIFTENVDMPDLEVIEDIVNYLDKNKDGKISYDEFVATIKNHLD